MASARYGEVKTSGKRGGSRRADPGAWSDGPVGRTHLRRMPLPVEQDEPNGQEPGFYEVQDEPPDPIDVSPLGGDAVVVVQTPDDAADRV